MKRVLIFLFLGLLLHGQVQAQHLFEHTYPWISEEQPQIRTLMNKVSTDTLEALIQHLQDYPTRQWNSQTVYEVQDWIYQTYLDLGYDSVYLHDYPVYYHDSLFDSSDNVIAIKKGTRYPDEYVVCGAHYDSYNKNPGDPDSLLAPGADDNASGTAGIMETARLLAPCTFERSVIFCHFGSEEIGLIGSAAYAKDCAEQLMDIVGYFNLDMIGYLEEGSDIHVNLLYRTRDSIIADYVFNFCDVYYPEMRVWQSWLPGGSDSDYSSFNRNGYASIQPFENTHHSSPFIHTPNDILGVSVNSMEQVKRFTELNLGLVTTLAGLVSNEAADDPMPRLAVMPNPANERITVNSVPLKQVLVYNLMGQCVFSRSCDGETECSLEVGSLVPGIYFVQVMDQEGRILTEKIVKS